MASEKEKTRIREILRAEFPDETVDVSDGYGDYIHIVLVSRRFDDFENERAKQEFVWGLLESAGVPEEVLNNITLILPVSPGQLK